VESYIDDVVIKTENLARKLHRGFTTSLQQLEALSLEVKSREVCVRGTSQKSTRGHH
jgi:hypothetical protein